MVNINTLITLRIDVVEEESQHYYKDMSVIQESITQAVEMHSSPQYQCLISQIYTQKPIKRQSDCLFQKCLMKAS